MKVVILRHATRTASGIGDSPLSAVGLTQATELASGLLSPSGPLPPPTEIWVSPKLRARETLTPLSEKTKVPLKTHAELDERHQTETMVDFLARIRQLLGSLESNTAGCIYLCTHLDWLEEAMSILTSDMTELEVAAPWMTAEFRIFQIEERFWKLKARGRAE